MKIKHALKAAVIAATLAVASASHATNIDGENSYLFYSTDSNVFGNQFNVLSLWTMKDAGVYTNSLAFCIDPHTDGFSTVTNYGSAPGIALSSTDQTLVRNLYESSYFKVSQGGSLNVENAASFQLALWSLTNPELVTIGENGGQYETNNAVAVEANQMIYDASHYDFTTAHYTFTTFASDTHASQTVLVAQSIAAVPEADTWAMMTLGLGLLGFVARRKSVKRAQAAA